MPGAARRFKPPAAENAADMVCNDADAEPTPAPRDTAVGRRLLVTSVVLAAGFAYVNSVDGLQLLPRLSRTTSAPTGRSRFAIDELPVRTYFGEEDWRLPPSPPADLPALDADGCFGAFREQGYAVVAACGLPSNVRPELPNGVVRAVGGCVFTNDNRCCEEADGVLWDVRRKTNMRYTVKELVALRQAKPQQIWIAESTESYQSWSKRPLTNPAVMRQMDYAAYWGLSADFPLLPNYDYRNEVYRDLIAWPGRNVTFRTVRPLPELLAAKTDADPLYLSSACTDDRRPSSRGSNRDSFVRLFMTYMHVDSEGTCLNNHDPQEHAFTSYDTFRAAAAALIQNHKFRLVLPNSICEDYVVEKFSQTIQHATIPIFLGAPTGKKFDPGLAAGVHPAAIYVEDFVSLRAVVDHVVAIAQNESRYLRYFEWVGRSARAWPTHFEEIEARRQGATSLIQYACDRTLDGYVSR